MDGLIWIRIYMISCISRYIYISNWIWFNLYIQIVYEVIFEYGYGYYNTGPAPRSPPVVQHDSSRPYVVKRSLEELSEGSKCFRVEGVRCLMRVPGGSSHTFCGATT